MAEMRMMSMRRSAAERKDAQGPDADGDNDMPPERDDVQVRLEHHHIGKMGMDGPLPHGTPVTFHGEGEVAESGTHEGFGDGEPRHHMTIRLRRAGVAHKADRDGERETLRGELSKAADDAADRKR